jgi:guanylate kinase
MEEVVDVRSVQKHIRRLIRNPQMFNVLRQIPAGFECSSASTSSVANECLLLKMTWQIFEEWKSMMQARVSVFVEESALSHIAEKLIQKKTEKIFAI